MTYKIVCIYCQQSFFGGPGTSKGIKSYTLSSCQCQPDPPSHLSRANGKVSSGSDIASYMSNSCTKKDYFTFMCGPGPCR